MPVPIPMPIPRCRCWDFQMVSGSLHYRFHVKLLFQKDSSIALLRSSLLTWHNDKWVVLIRTLFFLFTVKNSAISPNLLVWKLCVKAECRLFTKFPHQEIKRNYDIVHSVLHIPVWSKTMKKFGLNSNKRLNV